MISILIILALTNTAFSENMPKWITDKSAACKSSELCAVGSGSSMTLAKSVARAELAKIFENNISSEFRSELSSYNDESQESVSEQVNELTNVVLEGVEITKVYEGTIDYFAMAAIDKNKAARKIKKQIDKLDLELSELFEKKSAGALTQIDGLHLKRESLNQRYNLLTGMFLKSSVDYKKFLHKKNEVLNKYLLYISVTDSSDLDNALDIKKVVEEKLIGSGYKISPKMNTLVTNEVLGEFSAEKLYLKVKGFVRYRFSMSLKAKNKKDKETGALHFTTDVNARNFEQAKDVGLKRLSNYLSENIKQLNVE